MGTDFETKIMDPPRAVIEP